MRSDLHQPLLPFGEQPDQEEPPPPTGARSEPTQGGDLHRDAGLSDANTGSFDPAKRIQARKEAFQGATRHYDLLLASAEYLGFGEPELEETFDRWAEAESDLTEARSEERSDVEALEQKEEGLEAAFVAAAEQRWAARLEEFPELGGLRDEATRRRSRGESMTDLRVRRVLGVDGKEGSERRGD